MAASGSGRGDVRRCAAATDTSKREVRQIVSFCPVYQLDSVTLRLESEMDRDGTLNGDGQIQRSLIRPRIQRFVTARGGFLLFFGPSATLSPSIPHTSLHGSKSAPAILLNATTVRKVIYALLSKGFQGRTFLLYHPCSPPGPDAKRGLCFRPVPIHQGRCSVAGYFLLALSHQIVR